jgi:hypothetical protein
MFVCVGCMGTACCAPTVCCVHSAKAVRIQTKVGATRRVAPTDLVREGGLRLYGNDFSRMVLNRSGRLKPSAYRQSQPTLAKIAM